MTATLTVTGNLTQDPEVRYLSSGKPVTDLRFGCTRRRNNNGTWEDDGAPLFISASLFGAEATWVADALGKGDSVTVTGDLVRRTYTRQDGSEGEALEVRFPRLLGYIRKADRQASAAATPNTGGQNLNFQPPF